MIPDQFLIVEHPHVITMGRNGRMENMLASEEVLARAGIEYPSRLLAPLLSAPLDNALRLGDAALTGPISRGDVATVTSHLSTLAQEAPDVVASYVAMAHRTAERAQASGRLRPEQAASIFAALERR